MPRLNWQIVDRYVAGEATPAECAIVKHWLAESPAFRKLVEELYRGTLDDETIRKAATGVRARLENDIVPACDPDRRSTRHEDARVSAPRRAGVLRAAAIAALLGGVLVIWQTARTTNTQHADAHLRTITAPAGRRVPLSLPDGSQVILSPGSTLRYASTEFRSMARREVRLEGEAYFDVEHDARRPFVVRAGNLLAEDLGTQFVVRAYPEDPYGQVIVREGLVGMAGAVVAPGQLGRLAADGKVIVERADTVSWFAWTRGRLVFAHTPLSAALPKLSRWYDVQFRLDDPSLGKATLAGYFPETFSDDALNALELALGLNLTVEGRVVTIHSR